jgi:putative transposase
MIRTFRYPLKPTLTQETVLESWLVACCTLYNAALEQRREAWRKQRVGISRINQEKELTELRAVDLYWRTVPVWISRSALVRLERAYQGFFRRVNQGEKPGFPRFRSRDRYTSFDLGTNPVRVENNNVFLPKLGPVKFHKYREMCGVVLRVYINRTIRGWTVSFVCDLGDAPPKTLVRTTVGVDVGLESFATLSTGEHIENPRFFRAGEDVLARRQRSLARKKRGSSSRVRARRLVARAHEHIRNQRFDFVRKLAVTLFSRFDLIAYEELQIAHMVRGNLAKSINDAAWGRFLHVLTSKAEEAGKWAVAVDPRGTSQTCSRCDAVVKKKLSEREHRCDCGFVTHRDHNAALNIVARGLRVGPAPEASLEAEPRRLATLSIRENVT